MKKEHFCKVFVNELMQQITRSHDATIQNNLPNIKRYYEAYCKDYHSLFLLKNKQKLIYVVNYKEHEKYTLKMKPFHIRFQFYTKVIIPYCTI